MRQFTDKQLQEAIAALKEGFPGIWEQIKEVMQSPFEDNDEKLGQNMRAMRLTFAKLEFIARTERPSRVAYELMSKVLDVARREMGSN